MKELALAGIKTVEAANGFIHDVYVPVHNARFSVKAQQEGPAFVAIPGAELKAVLCIQQERQFGSDNTVTFHRHRLQIPPTLLRVLSCPLRPHFVKCRPR